MKEMHIFVSGAVQGVGFRAAVRKHAILHGIKGYVCNLPDGRVEICAQGHENQIVCFLQSVEANPGAGVISNIETQLKLMRETYRTFEVR